MCNICPKGTWIFGSDKTYFFSWVRFETRAMSIYTGQQLSDTCLDKTQRPSASDNFHLADFPAPVNIVLCAEWPPYSPDILSQASESCLCA